LKQNCGTRIRPLKNEPRKGGDDSVKLLKKEVLN
jgi:hypothetical protein